MIEVRLTSRGGNLELGKIEIENMVTSTEDELGDYTIRFGVDNGSGEVAVFQRYIEAFPRTKLNVLALLLQALNTLSEEDLSLADSTDASDMARKKRGALPPLQLG